MDEITTDKVKDFLQEEVRTLQDDPEADAPGFLAPIYHNDQIAIKIQTVIQYLEAKEKPTANGKGVIMNHDKCKYSIGYEGELTSGQGKLDYWGYFEKPCPKCKEKMQGKIKQTQ